MALGCRVRSSKKREGCKNETSEVRKSGLATLAAPPCAVIVDLRGDPALATDAAA